MYRSGLLVLSNVTEKQFVDQWVNRIGKLVREKLFLSFLHDSNSLPFWKRAMSVCYSSTSELCPSLDVYFILPLVSLDCKIEFDVLFSDADNLERALKKASQFCTSFKQQPIHLQPSSTTLSCGAHCKEQDGGFAHTPISIDSPVTSSLMPFANVCLGGTFDRLHNGHKILLSVGALLAKQRLLVGITADGVLKNKKLAPLILPHDVRCDAIRSFLRDVGFSPSKLELASLVDTFGPPAHISEYDCIVSSAESFANCVELNRIRLAKGMNVMHIEQIDFISERSALRPLLPSDLCESKLSSSILRFNLLGTLLRPVNKGAARLRGTRTIYVIGLIGSSGAGKSSLAARLANLSTSVHVVDCDRLGHDAYKPGTTCYQKLIDYFGYEAIVSPEPPHLIDRSRLGKLVFANPRHLAILNSFVWPEIKRLICDLLLRLDNQQGTSTPIVVLDAAVLLQAGWDEMCEEIWMAVIPKAEALRRICERTGLDQQAANERLCRQASAVAEVVDGMDWWDVGQINTGRGPVGRSHVVLSTEWEPECSQQQVEKAFRELQNRLPTAP